MARLAPEEAAHYQREGWVIPEYRLPPARVATMVNALETLLRDNPGVRPEKLVSAHVAGDNGELSGTDLTAGHGTSPCLRAVSIVRIVVFL